MISAQCIGFLKTPSLWANKQFGIQQFEFPKLKLDSFYPTLIPSNIRLGHQMEHVFKQLVEFSKSYDVVLHNLPIRQGNRTLGEIDFILNDITQNKSIHVEMTYKFYLIDPGINDPIQSLIGPNRRDKFFTKMEKIKNIQFPLLHSEEGSKALKDHDIDHLKIEHQCCFKAQLFKPYGRNMINIGSLNKDCMAGYWLQSNDFNIPEFANDQYYIPSKSEWVIDVHDQVDWKSHAEIRQEVNGSLLRKNAPLLWRKSGSAEFEKFFVV